MIDDSLAFAWISKEFHLKTYTNGKQVMPPTRKAHANARNCLLVLISTAPISTPERMPVSTHVNCPECPVYCCEFPFEYYEEWSAPVDALVNTAASTLANTPLTTFGNTL